MDGSSALKMYRKKKKYTVNQLAAIIDISQKTITEYENEDTERNITSIAAIKAIQLFKELEIDMDVFFDTYYPYKEELQLRKAKREDEIIPTNLTYAKLKKRIVSRLSHIKERNKVSLDVSTHLYHLYTKTFDELYSIVNSKDLVTKSNYIEFILPLLYEIRKQTCEFPTNTAGQCVIDAVCRTAFDFTDIAELCDCNPHHFMACIKERKYTFKNMKIKTVLSLCYILNISIYDLLIHPNE